jgi:DNA polymerase-3 subunit delta'
MEMIGQETVERHLRHALSSGRLPHGLLLVGPGGSGRRHAAHLVARGLLCDAGRTDQPAHAFGCGNCPSCRRVENGAHPDFHRVMSEAAEVAAGLAENAGKGSPSSEIKVDAIRALTRTLHMRAFEDKARVVLIVDAHRLNVQAANALLKTLEEPLPQTHILLTAPSGHSVLPTIHSRCARLFFSPLNAAAIQAILEKRGLDPDQALVRAERAGGSVSRALEVDLTESGGSQVRQWVREVSAAPNGKRARLAADLGRDRLEVDAFLGKVLAVLVEGLKAPAAHLPLGRAEALRLADALVVARKRIRQHVNPQLVLETLLLAHWPAAAGRAHLA